MYASSSFFLIPSLSSSKWEVKSTQETHNWILFRASINMVTLQTYSARLPYCVWMKEAQLLPGSSSFCGPVPFLILIRSSAYFEDIWAVLIWLLLSSQLILSFRLPKSYRWCQQWVTVTEKRTLDLAHSLRPNLIRGVSTCVGKIYVASFSFTLIQGFSVENTTCVRKSTLWTNHKIACKKCFKDSCLFTPKIHSVSVYWMFGLCKQRGWSLQWY